MEASHGLLVDQILTYRNLSSHARRIRSQEFLLSIRVNIRRLTARTSKVEQGDWGGGLFIESFTPLTVGTKLVMEFTLPETPNEWLSAKGMIAWVCLESRSVHI